MELIRFFFSKKEEASYISHLDLQRVMARSLRRSGIPVWYSQGFNPHIYMTFSLPLPLMQHSETETMDCKTQAEGEDFSRYILPLNQALPKGIVVSRIATPIHKADAIDSAEYTISYAGMPQELHAAVAAYNAANTAIVTRKTKRSEQQVDLKEAVARLAILEGTDDRFTLRLPAGSKINYNPELMTHFLAELSGLPADSAYILRKQVYTVDHQVFC